MTRPNPIAEPLTRRGGEIMNAGLALGNRASTEEIRARLTSPPGDSSVRVMLARLEKKGCLKHQQDGLRYLYSATISPAVPKPSASRPRPKTKPTVFARKEKSSHDARSHRNQWSHSRRE